MGQSAWDGEGTALVLSGGGYVAAAHFTHPFLCIFPRWTKWTCRYHCNAGDSCVMARDHMLVPEGLLEGYSITSAPTLLPMSNLKETKKYKLYHPLRKQDQEC